MQSLWSSLWSLAVSYSFCSLLQSLWSLAVSVVSYSFFLVSYSFTVFANFSILEEMATEFCVTISLLVLDNQFILLAKLVQVIFVFLSSFREVSIE